MAINTDGLAARFALRFRDARWSFERHVTLRATSVRFRCVSHGSFLVSDATLHDARSADLMIAKADRVYIGSHQQYLFDSSQMQPMYECAVCQLSGPLVIPARLAPQQRFEHAERQSNLWMKHALELRSKL